MGVLEDKSYDLKVWIENKQEKTISEIYDDDADKWKSGNYYLNDLLNKVIMLFVYFVFFSIKVQTKEIDYLFVGC